MAERMECHEPLLAECEKQTAIKHTPRSAPATAWRRMWYICQIMVFGANMLIFVWTASSIAPASMRRPFELIDAPIRAKTVTWDASLGLNYSFTAMDPTVADAAWAEIAVTTSQGYVKLSKKQIEHLKKYSPSSVRAADGSGYLGLVGVFHQLHCLDYLRKTNVLYSHFYPETLQHPTVPVELHIPHCINLLRMALQCYGELTTSTHNWVDGWIEPWEDWKTQHQCRDFDAIRKWARENNGMTPNTYVHPELGPVISADINLSALPVGRELRYVAVDLHGIE